MEVEEEILGILCLPCANQQVGTLKFWPQFCEAGNSPTGERKKLRLRKDKQINYIHYSSWKGSKCFMEMTPWVVEGTCSKENKLENSFEIFNMWHNQWLKQALERSQVRLATQCQQTLGKLFYEHETWYGSKASWCFTSWGSLSLNTGLIWEFEKFQMAMLDFQQEGIHVGWSKDHR